MRSLFFSGFLPGLLLLSFSFFASFVAAAPGVIEGRIINGTVPEQEAAVKEVALYRIKEDQSPDTVGSQKPKKGRYRFEDLEVSPQYRYRLSVNYQEIPYFSDEIVFGHGQARENIRTSDLTVYEVTKDIRQIHVTRDHLILDIVDQDIVATEFLLLENSGNRTVWNEKLIRFSLPEGYRDFRGPGKPIISNGIEGFWLGEPVLPGANQILFSYRLNFSGAAQELRKPIDYPTDQLDLLIADKGLDVQSLDLSFEGSVDMKGRGFMRWIAADLRPGTIVSLSLSTSALTRYFYQGGAVAIILLLVGTGFAFPLAKARKAKKSRLPSTSHPSTTGKDTAADLRQERKKLIIAIAELDDRHDAGELQGEDHRRARTPKLRKVVELTRQLKDQGR
ncbi:MAG: hypothetical protein ACE5JO_10460 [Candidatus Binatia bacterium]